MVSPWSRDPPDVFDSSRGRRYELGVSGGTRLMPVLGGGFPHRPAASQRKPPARELLAWRHKLFARPNLSYVVRDWKYAAGRTLRTGHRPDTRRDRSGPARL